ncbi:hypothetical protein [Pontibacter mangrovi]|uniref:Uncharacterized protein n=1 Tax=Pontibacter mangrovi TaxID=2589816 RepID=A0A501W778_9BACT|nr:hypothetical protein [Pontibacter mangrovi]TPE45429.1 hypothetical protein FJM65_05210 [Pontibacter mangrovi]
MLQLYWLLSLPLVLLLLWLAWRRPNRQRLAWRLLASAVAAISLVLLVFPPTFRQAVSPGTAMLLTDGFSTDTLDALLQRTKAKPTIYTYNVSSGEGEKISSLAELQQRQPALQRLHLLGYGLAEAELEQLQRLQVLPHLSPGPTGMQAVSWPQSTALGKAVAIEGTYAAAAQPAKLYLLAQGQLRDSVEIPADSTYTFLLRYTPKVAGRYTYALLQKAGAAADTLGQIPVQVEPPQPLRILFLAASPAFEFKFLKNHLARLQHRVAFRAQISKEVSQSEWLNMARTNLNRLTPSLLHQFDVMITEPAALKQLSPSERNILQQAVTADGLGVLTVAFEPATTRSTAFFTGFRYSRNASKSTRALWPAAAASITEAPSFELTKSPAVKPLVTGSGNAWLAGAKNAGWGKVALSLVPQTYPWQLEGKPEVYASYWSHVLQEVARAKVQEQYWEVTQPQAPQPGKPVILTYTDYTSDNATAPSTSITSIAQDTTSISLALAQHPHQPEKYSATFWPTRSGWHKVQASAPYFFFVQDTAGWEFESIKARRAASLAFAAQQQAKPVDAATAYTSSPLHPAWFFILFVLSSAFLWLEEKL